MFLGNQTAISAQNLIAAVRGGNAQIKTCGKICSCGLHKIMVIVNSDELTTQKMICPGGCK